MQPKTRKRVLNAWQAIAADISIRYPHLSAALQDQTAQQIVNMLVFLYFCADRHLISPTALRSLQLSSNCGADVLQLLGSPGLSAQFSLCVEDTVLKAALRELEAAFESAAQQQSSPMPLPTELLGEVHELLLGQPSFGSQCDRPGETKPNPASVAALQNRKTGGVYYTPTSVVDYIIHSTIAAWLEQSLPQSNPAEIPAFRLLDPSCGGGAFLVAAYQWLLKHQLQRYVATNPQQYAQSGADGYPRITRWRNEWCLTHSERSRLLLTHIYGVDLDPLAIEVTRRSLLLVLLDSLPPHDDAPIPNLSHNIRCGNALISSEISSDFIDTELDWRSDCRGSGLPCTAAAPQSAPTRPLDWEDCFPNVMQSGGFEVVLGNPPYVDAEWMTRHLPAWRQYCSTHYRTATGNWDLFCVFIEKALALCKPGGFTSFIVPNKLASASYAASVRSLLTQHNHLLSIRDYSRVALFPAGVYPLVFVARKVPSPANAVVFCEVMEAQGNTAIAVKTAYSVPYSCVARAESPWLVFDSPERSQLVARLQQAYPCLKQVATVTGAATVAEAYALRSLIHNNPDLQSGDLQLINSGTIDRYCSLWGRRRLRYLGSSYLHPVIRKNQVTQLPSKRYRQATQPKIVVAGMTKYLECIGDLTGTLLAGKSTSVISVERESDDDLRYLLGLLNSRLVNVIFGSSFGGDRLSGGYLRVGPPQLRQLPIPSPDDSRSTEPSCYTELVDQVEKRLWLSGQQMVETSGEKRGELQQQIKSTEQQIDRLVYQLYRLTDAEIEIIDSSHFDVSDGSSLPEASCRHH